MDDRSNKSLDGLVPTNDQNDEPKKISVTEEPVATEPVLSEPTVASEPVVSEPVQNFENTDTEPTAEEDQTSNYNETPIQQTEPTAQPPNPLPVINNDPTTKPEPTELDSLKKRNKRLKLWLIIFIVIFVGLASALAVYFSQNSKAQADLDKQVAQNQQLQNQITQQQQSATQSQINELNTQIASLKTENADLTKQIKTQTEYITALTKTTTQLKTACGTACASITIPAPPAGVSTTTN